jgi:hypothetical protein
MAFEDQAADGSGASSNIDLVRHVNARLVPSSGGAVGGSLPSAAVLSSSALQPGAASSEAHRIAELEGQIMDLKLQLDSERKLT